MESKIRVGKHGPGREKKVAGLEATLRSTEASQLKPEKVDFHVDKNRKDHHTDEYAIDSLIVRRGQEFKVSVTFDRPFDAKQDKLVLELTTGTRPQENKKSLIRVKEVDQLSTSSWGMRIEHINDNVVSLTVMSAADALVGKYSVNVEIQTKKVGSEAEEYLTFKTKFEETIYVLFNAWCKDDTVYMEKDEHRKEYVLNDHGRIWTGNKRRFTGIPWNFGQFESVSLPTCLYILETCANMTPTARGNPILVSRVITQMANFNDRDGGILVGNWSGNYPSSTTAPSSWTGSVGILEEFSKTHDGVCYGQCWVFSGLVTTMLRAIGIPTRSVTNFESAHDTDASMTIDFHFDKNGDPLDHLNDSVWNFHVWNESYFDRPDLPDGNKGWQAIDATPQERSDGFHRCGPCPVNAIKAGEVYFPYDTGFVFAEVNGDRVYWDVDTEMKVSVIDKRSIGKFISTKAVGSAYRNDLTHDYKYPEGSAEERKAVLKANKFSSRKDEDIYSKPTSHDVEFTFLPPVENIRIGSDFDVNLFVKNTSKEQRSIHFTLTTKMAFYTGITAQNLSTLRDDIVVQGNQAERNITLPVPASDYIGKAPAEACVKVFIKAKVQETGQEFNAIETVEFSKPEIIALPPDKFIENESFEMILYFTNPLAFNLTNCVFKLESSRHLSPDTITKALKNPVKPKEKALIVVTLKSDRRGTRRVDVSFHADQLSGVRGEFEFNVTI